MADPHMVGDKAIDDPSNKTAQSTVTCVHQTKLVGMCRSVIIVWSKNLINLSLSITANSPTNENHYICKIDFKPWHFWSKKGYKYFDVEGQRVEVFWDLRAAKFSGSPEPYSDFYVALVHDEEVVLLIGDLKKKAYKRTKSRPSLVDATIVYKKENLFGKKCYSTKAKFDHLGKKDHDIVIENSIAGPRDPEMWISVDGIVVIHVTNLQWKFRGNGVVMVNKNPVQVFWDVHDWLFGVPGSSHGMFIFRPGAPDYKPCKDIDGSSNGGTDETGDSGSENGFFSADSRPENPDYSLFIYAWKVE